MNSLRRVLAIVRHELRVLKEDVGVVIILLGMPLVLLIFLRPTFRLVAVGQGRNDLNGSEFTVPGLGVTAAFFFVGYIALSFFREFSWNTWDRLRATELRPVETIAGKLIPLGGVALAQQVALFGLGHVFFSLPLRGSIPGIMFIAVMLAFCLVSLGIAIVSVCRTIQQVEVFQTLGAVLFAGLGGAFTPHALLPDWVRLASPATPSYWALRGYRAFFIDGAGFSASIVPAMALGLFTLGFSMIALLKFRFESTKTVYG